MAEVSSIFRVKGRIGNTIFSVRNGKCYARAVSTSVKNPNTPKQQVSRARFRVAVRFYQHLKDSPLGEVWRQAGKKAKLTGFTLFMRENLNMFDHEGKIVDYDGLHLAVGNRCEEYRLSASLDEAGRVTISWSGGEEDSYLGNDDRLMVAYMYGDRSFSPEVVSGLNVTRREGTATFELLRLRKVPIHLYCFFVAPGGENFSNSQHLII